MNPRRKLVLLAFLSAAALVASCGAPATPAATATSPPTATAPPTATEEIPEAAHPEIARVSLEDAKAAWDSGSALFLDVRGMSTYSYSHISGAINIPYYNIDDHLAELDKGEWIITYCG